MMRKRCKQILCVILSLILISGSIATFRPQNVKAATTVVNKYDFGLSLQQLDDKGNWMFYRSGVDTSVGQYFYFDAYVDGAKKTLWLEFTGEYTYIYSGVFNQAPTTSFRIPKGTAFTQYQSDGNNGLEKVEGGNTLCLKDTFYAVKGENGWEEQEYEAELGLTFSKVDDNKNWWFTPDISDEYKNNEGVYYQAQIYVDGAERTVWFEIVSGVCFIYSNTFAGDVPNSSLEIKKGTVLYEAVNAGESKKENGLTITVKNNLCVVKTDAGWTTQTAIELKPTGMRPETDNTWYVVLDNDTVLTGNYYKATISIDGEEQIVALQKYSAVNGLVIWPSFFSAIENGKSVPQSSIEIKKGTKLYPIDPDKSGWTQVVSGNTYVISDTIKAVKYGDTWVTNPQTKDSSATPEYYNIDNGLTYQVNATNNAYEIKKGSETITDTTLTQVGTYDITRIENGTVFVQKIVLYKTGDVNADNTTDIKDLVAIKDVVAGSTEYDLAGMYAADMNRSGTVDAVDVRGLRYQLANGLSSSKGVNILNGKMPITGYDGPEYQYLLDHPDTYSYIKDLGINMVALDREESGSKLSQSLFQLSEAEKNGIRVYINNGYIYDKENADGIADSDGSVKTDRYRNITAQYDGYRSFAGYYLYDEPYYNAKVNGKYCLDDLTTAFQALEKQANVHGYLNLFPYITNMNNQLSVNSSNKNILTKDSYQTYVKKASTVGAEFLSYDLYLRSDKAVQNVLFWSKESYEIRTEHFYKNLSWMRETAAEEGKPYHAFIQVGTDFSSSNDKSTEQKNLTTVQEMYLEANVALAMGAKGLNYYSLVQPSEYAKNTDSTYDYHRSGLLSANGEKNNGAGGANYEYYNAAKKINTYVDKIDEVLMNSENQALIVTNSTVKGYLGDTVTSWNELSSVSGDEMLVGCFNYYGKSAYLVVNITPDEGKTGSSKSVTLNFTGSPAYTYTGMDCVSHSGNDNALTLTIPAGESVLVVMD